MARNFVNNSRHESRPGVARIRNASSECRHDYFRPLSGKGFGPFGGQPHRLRPSCNPKRSLLFFKHLDKHLGHLSRLTFSLIDEFSPTDSGKPICAEVVANEPFGNSRRIKPHFSVTP